MSNKMKNLIDSMDLSSTAKRKNYGTIERGLQVNKYRSKIITLEMEAGSSYEQASKAAHEAVIGYFGSPK